MENNFNTLNRTAARILLLVVVGLAMTAAGSSDSPSVIAAFKTLCWLAIVLNVYMLLLDIRDLTRAIRDYRREEREKVLRRIQKANIDFYAKKTGGKATASVPGVGSGETVHG